MLMLCLCAFEALGEHNAEARPVLLESGLGCTNAGRRGDHHHLHYEVGRSLENIQPVVGLSRYVTLGNLRSV